ncbi:MAG: Zn-dependent hydrolase [Planctomycetes bacterium]|nr:Zn-dependent hydrolase [Planctomycetota bacterium]
MADRVKSYAEVRLTTDLKKLSPDERKMIPLLIEAAEQMHKIFWIEAYGDRQKLLASISDPATRQFAKINYGPWDRLGDDKPFVPGVKAKPLGANFYPQDMTKEKFEQALAKQADQAKELKSLYTIVRRDAEGKLKAIPYHEFFKEPTRIAAEKLEQAAALAKDPGLKKYLTLRAKALRTGKYRESDEAWLDMKNNGIDIVIGPIETYEDKLFGYKAAHEAYVLVKDKKWSKKLAEYAKFLPDLQRALPVGDEFKSEEPGTDSDLNAYDVIYYAGDCNAGAKTIAINLPNDEQVQLKKGTRRLQLKNVMRAKFDKILMPIAKELIAEDQLKHVTFDAFFENTMFHEVAHGLGIKNTINGKGTVREALQDLASTLEEGKADVLGLFMIEQLREGGAITGGDIKDNYVTFLAGMFRSIRFGAASAHGRANMLRFNWFNDMKAVTRDSATGKYRVDFDSIPKAVEALSSTILTFQGRGNYDGYSMLMAIMGSMRSQLRSDLDGLRKAGIPVDIVFKQGMAELK